MSTSFSLARRLSGGTHPRAVSLAVFLGLLAGFAQGWNLSLIALMVLVVLFDVRSRVALVCWAIGLGLSWALAPATFLLGRVVLDLTPVGSWLGNIEGAAALFGWDRYTLVGGLLIGLALAWPASSLLTRGVRRTRRLLHQARELRSRLHADSTPDVIAFPRTRMSWRARFADWMRGSNAASAPEHASNRLFRPGGLPVAAALVMVAGGIVFWHVPRIMSGNLYLALQQANQARLEAAEFNLALWDGSLEISDLRLADPSCLTHDRIRIEQLRADLDPAALLRGRLLVRRLDVSGVRTGIERAAPAEPIANRGVSPCLDTAPPAFGNQAGIDDEPQTLEQCLANWPELKGAIARLGGLLSQLQSLDRFEQPRVAPLTLTAIAQIDLAVLRHSRSTLGRQAPWISVGSLRAEVLDPTWNLGGRATLHAESISSHATANSESTRFEIDSPDHATRVWGQYAPHQGTPRWVISLQAREVPIAKLLAQSSTRQAMAIDGGRVSLSGTGWADATGFELPLAIEAYDLACHAQERRSVAGINSEHWALGLARLNQFALAAGCRGDWQAPRLLLDRQDVANRFRAELQAAGQHELLAAMNARPTRPVEITTHEVAHPSALAVATSAAHAASEQAAIHSQPALDPTTLTVASSVEQSTTPAQADAIHVNRPDTVAADPELPSVEPGSAAASSQPIASSPVTVYPMNMPQRTAAAVAQTPPQGNASPTRPVTPNGVASAPVDEQVPAIRQAETSSHGLVADRRTAAAPQPRSHQVGTGPLQGPGPLDLAVGHDTGASLWKPASEPRGGNVPQGPKPASLADATDEGLPYPTDAELDEWVEQQERIEARRERALVKAAKSRKRSLEADAKRNSLDDEPMQDSADSPSLMARVRSLWPFKGRAAEQLDAEPLSPSDSGDETARTARGQVEAPSAGGSAWR